jgi:phytoene dehydrogenase-like protein
VTYLDLAGKENLSARLTKKLFKTKYSVTSLILFLTLDLDVTKAGLDSGNIWMVNDQNLDNVFNELTNKDIESGDEFPAVFISCTTLKDPASFNGRHHTMEIVTFIDYACFRSFNFNGDYHGDAYTRLKDRIIQKLMTSLEKVIPGVKQHIVQLELGTPKTNEYYVNTTDGCVYGTEKTLHQIGPFAFQNKSEIRNLFLCGASTLFHSVSGATLSGVAAAAKILDCSTRDLLVPDENQNIRIYDAEDSTTWPDWVHQKRKDRNERQIRQSDAQEQRV